jgi:hypothetical protein
MALNQGDAGFHQFPNEFRPISFNSKPSLVSSKEIQELAVPSLGIFVSGAPEPKHARFLLLEVPQDEIFQKLHEPHKQFKFVSGRIRTSAQFFQAVDIRDQHPVLGVNQGMPGFILFVPVEHVAALCRSSRNWFLKDWQGSVTGNLRKLTEFIGDREPGHSWCALPLPWPHHQVPDRRLQHP